MSDTPHVRAMRDEDVGICSHIIEQIPLFRDYHLTAQGMQQTLQQALMRPDDVLRVGIYHTSTGPLVAGFAWFLPKGAFARSGYLRLLAIHPQAHGQGIGRALMEHLEALHLHPHGITLLTSDHNHRAHRFYERLGYQQVGLLPNYVQTGLHERIYFKAAPHKDSP